MSVNIPHIVERDGVFQYTRRVPKAVIDRPGALDRYFGGKRVIRVSLRTNDPIEAVRRAKPHHSDFERRLSLALDSGAPALPQRLRPVTIEALQVIASERRRVIENTFRNYVRLRELGGDQADYAEHMIYQEEMDAEALIDAAMNYQSTDDPRKDFDSMAQAIVAENDFDAPLDSDAFFAIKRMVRETEVLGRRDGFDILSGKRSILPDAASPAADRSSLRKAPKLSKAVEDHISAQTNRRTIQEINDSFKSFIDVVGDLRLDQLRPDHFRSFCQAEAAHEVGGASKGSVRRPKAAATIKKKLTLLRSAITHAIERGEFDGQNPAHGIKVEAFARPISKATMPDKRPMTVDELAMVLAHPWFTGCASSTRRHRAGDHRLTGMWYWGPIIAMLTGCRAGEIGGLALDEIMLDDTFPHIVIRDNQFRTTKGGYRRKVPILDQLLELGFADFVNHRRTSGGVRLFDDWKPPRGHSDADNPAWSNATMVRAFNTTLVPKALKSVLLEGARREVTFHSLRGSFKTLISLQRYGIHENYRNEVVGHAKGELDRRYIGELPIEETYPAVRACRYDGLIFPAAPPLT